MATASNPTRYQLAKAIARRQISLRGYTRAELRHAEQQLRQAAERRPQLSKWRKAIGTVRKEIKRQKAETAARKALKAQKAAVLAGQAPRQSIHTAREALEAVQSGGGGGPIYLAEPGQASGGDVGGGTIFGLDPMLLGIGAIALVLFLGRRRRR